MNNNNRYTPAAISVSITALLFTVIYFVFGFHYEIPDDSYRIAFMQSLYYEKAIDDFFIYLIGISQALAFLYRNFLNVEWYSYFTLIALFISLSSILYMLLRLFTGLFKSQLINTVLPILIYISFAIYYVVAWHWTKTACISTIAALLLCLYKYPKNFSTKASIAWLMCLFILMLLGLAIRYQNVLVLLLIASMYTIIVHSTIRPLILPIVITFIFLVGLEVRTGVYAPNDTKLLNQIEPYVFSHLDAGSIKCNTPDTIPIQDELKIAAFEDWFFTDFAMITPAFLNTYYTSSILSVCSIKNIGPKLRIQWNDYGDYLITNLSSLIILAVIALLVACSYMPGRQWLRPLAFNILFALLMFAIAVVIKLEKRHLTPFITLLCLCNIITAVQAYSKQITKTVSAKLYLSILVVSCLLVIPTCYAHSFSMFKLQEEAFGNELRKEIETNFKNKKVAMDVWTCLAIAYSAPFQRATINQNKNYIIYDSGYGMFYSTARDEIERKTGGKGFKQYMLYLQHHKHDIVFIQQDKRSKLFTDYMAGVYNIDLTFSEIKGNYTVNESSNYCTHKNIGYYVIN